MDNCTAQQTCTNTEGSFICTILCDPGYSAPNCTGKCTHCRLLCGTRMCNWPLQILTSVWMALTTVIWMQTVPTLLEVLSVCVIQDIVEMDWTALVRTSVTSQWLMFYDWFCSPYADINECLSDVCHVNAICTNTLGSFVCSCSSGYTGDGVTCSGEEEWEAKWEELCVVHLTSLYASFQTLMNVKTLMYVAQ